jgi:hypothetical protein
VQVPRGVLSLAGNLIRDCALRLQSLADLSEQSRNAGVPTGLHEFRVERVGTKG